MPQGSVALMTTYSKFSRFTLLLALSLIITCWEVTSCWGATLTVTLPDAHVQRVVDAVCQRKIKWPVWAEEAACQQGSLATVQAIFETVKAYIQTYVGQPVDATLEIAP